MLLFESVECGACEAASGVASRAGSRDAVVGFHDSRVNEGALSSEIPQMRRLSFTADCTALGVRPRRAEPLTFGGCGSQLPSAPVAALPSLGPYTLGGWSSGLSALLEVFQCEAKGKPNTNYDSWLTLFSRGRDAERISGETTNKNH